MAMVNRAQTLYWGTGNRSPAPNEVGFANVGIPQMFSIAGNWHGGKTYSTGLKYIPRKLIMYSTGEWDLGQLRYADPLGCRPGGGKADSKNRKLHQGGVCQECVGRVQKLPMRGPLKDGSGSRSGSQRIHHF